MRLLFSVPAQIRAAASCARKPSQTPKIDRELFKLPCHPPELPSLPALLSDKEIRIRAGYSKVIEQHEQHAAFWSKKCHFQGKSLHLDVSVDGDPTASLDFVSGTLAREFKSWVASDGALEVSSYGKMWGLKTCLQLSKAGAASASMVKAEILHGIASQGVLATVGGVYVAGSVASGGGLTVFGSAAGLVGEVATSSAHGEGGRLFDARSECPRDSLSRSCP